jgi:hypothetical protein
MKTGDLDDFLTGRQAVIAEMRLRPGVHGIRHEDGDFSYWCGGEWCRCAS